MLRQVKYIDDDHVDAIEPEDTTIEKSDSFLEEINAMEEKIFVLSKFAKFQFLSVDDLQSWAEEALK
jgi:predicted HicB family RNase H-like nuclease